MRPSRMQKSRKRCRRHRRRAQPAATFACSCRRMQSSFNGLQANKVQSARELFSENAIDECDAYTTLARLLEGIEPLRDCETNCAALAVQRRHSPLRHIFARSVIASRLIVSVAPAEARLDARTKVGRGAADTPLDRSRRVQRVFRDAAPRRRRGWCIRAPTRRSTFQYGRALVANRAAARS